ncbi:50S ribosomal protein L2 [Candidatus Gottesmanbacteria bacterium CG11_big_fil_rev_8_21_14_0_20_37_11]|uniref:Large ribosomal subunit protein uL2 n=3 Tax=Candidatus Gottesmaniibacteriota TaxID=1752720 RepID=A0A2M7RR11_9BACT|nr:MAG: 50S ribosomal protein L2 [Candidatus Gottesmanbacteria bacterium CG1_02_37_22]PIP32614.1 MAG: 50S ribosomal protein L2 [Candidatus Gottesmanbacteria bacterium CG23_combo_of_CG06-09_8_20_14_all_37_19]PIR08490.1 MAG: 50S ribosomal protein L2 [Candidatus Gottesmanbacteria bacterium CG11_big_fil_rev_8_21_14_0_20_37_11]PIZ02630.1 MAG: 50S ribosomal protein L2 [Candidatus Gottesmanbacteria bacterium CG_4_10_14_0_8_um_filter_37_24]
MRDITKTKPEKHLIGILPSKAGRSNTGSITARHRGGREKRFYRSIDFKRNKLNIAGEILAFEYDPNRNVQIALVMYKDGEKRYILAPLGLSVGDKIMSGIEVEVKIGNSMPLKNVPVGTPIHNIELHPGKGGQLVRSAGGMAVILAKEGGFAQIKFPSSEVRMIREICFATIGQLANKEWKDTPLGKAGKSRHRGIRPKVRGTAQHPNSHPHGGGEGRSGVGLKQPKTPWGKPARGLITRNRHKYSNRYIIKKRS